MVPSVFVNCSEPQSVMVFAKTFMPFFFTDKQVHCHAWASFRSDGSESREVGFVLIVQSHETLISTHAKKECQNANCELIFTHKVGCN